MAARQQGKSTVARERQFVNMARHVEVSDTLSMGFRSKHVGSLRRSVLADKPPVAPDQSQWHPICGTRS
jgi:hypothetical protein